MQGRKLTEEESKGEWKLFFKPKKPALISLGIFIFSVAMADFLIGHFEVEYEFNSHIVFFAGYTVFGFFYGLYCGMMSERYRSSLPNQPVRDFFNIKKDSEK